MLTGVLVHSSGGNDRDQIHQRIEEILPFVDDIVILDLTCNTESIEFDYVNHHISGHDLDDNSAILNKILNCNQRPWLWFCEVSCPISIEHAVAIRRAIRTSPAYVQLLDISPRLTIGNWWKSDLPTVISRSYLEGLLNTFCQKNDYLTAFRKKFPITIVIEADGSHALIANCLSSIVTHVEQIILLGNSDDKTLAEIASEYHVQFFASNSNRLLQERLLQPWYLRLTANTFMNEYDWLTIFKLINQESFERAEFSLFDGNLVHLIQTNSIS